MNGTEVAYIYTQAKGGKDLWAGGLRRRHLHLEMNVMNERHETVVKKGGGGGAGGGGGGDLNLYHLDE